ncbi:HPP family protein [Desulfovibrio ferrophilus]|uniref:CBS protein n=1 Tax=Desulfovibrio ferrophilus TaxID=241368 RepID=A0A2Z6AUL0_9BACT|nr:CBS domain-containing protein [Desulfovibrio ferrophilus]BBD06900.1 CBS protein [Desulfovibrio ferrophilus]
MKNFKVRDFMMTTEQLTTIPETANIYEAADIFDRAQRNLEPDEFRYRALLVVDKNGQGVGKLSLLDIIAGLEPRYSQVEPIKMSRFGMTQEQLQSIFLQYGLWESSLVNLCKQADGIIVGDIMDTPNESELVHEDQSLSFAVHQFATGRHHNLVVHDAKGEITGLLRLADVYRIIRDELMECQMKGV